MPVTVYTFSSKIVIYPGVGGWRFVGIPESKAKEIKEKFGVHAKAWGSLPVSVTIGKTTWDTSIFPDKKSGSYLLPIKASVRKREGISDTSTVSFSLQFR